VKNVDDVEDVARVDVIDFDAAHMCMISQPAALARIINDIANRSEAPHSG
jgi:hypothetical protein